MYVCDHEDSAVAGTSEISFKDAYDNLLRTLDHPTDLLYTDCKFYFVTKAQEFVISMVPRDSGITSD